jgi:hypothetical protein
MDRIIDETELSDLVRRKDLTHYQICSEFPGRYQEAEKNDALEVIRTAVEVKNGIKVFATMSVKNKPYGLHAGIIISPSILEKEIVWNMPNVGWVLVKIKPEESYGAY